MDAWHAVAELPLKSGWKVGMSVRLKTGVEIVGHYSGASTDLDPSKRELILRRPFYFRDSDSPSTVPFDKAWQQMTIMGSEIGYIAVTYIDEKASEPTASTKSVGDAIASWVADHYLRWESASIAGVVILALLVGLGRW